MRFRIVEDINDTIDVAGKKWKKETYYIFKNGKLWRRSAAGDRPEDTRVYRKSAKWNFYIISFPRAALPFSTYLLANKETGDVYTLEVTHGWTSDYIKKIIDWMNDRYEPPKPAIIGDNPLI